MERRDFTVGLKEMMEIHGISYSTLVEMTNKGAFPYGLTGKGVERKKRVYHQSVTSLNRKQMKENAEIGKYKEPIFIDRGSEKPESKTSKLHDQIVIINRKLNAIMKEIGVELVEN